ncbi:hypothetical protein ACPOL_3830 [Acidisarcina polymorpha]|uniref:DUF2382 domain-containing protein n=1 Tax=Acidisarcina polymorpha TaxID=2211140 RepID=A0A2Z5G1Z9_9BACT|nr:YsnF/AvaK domain-containing protein [Acidisarcina polymorpha]AXC13109.1 hypothetical protein ACPOL_3830 [Acidisarcina polymorpha]
MANTTASSTTIVAYFTNESAAENAVSQLRDAGFSSSQIGVATRVSNPSDTGAAGTTASSTNKPAHAAGNQESAWDKVRNFFSSEPVEPYADERTRGDFASHEITGADPYTDRSAYSSEDVHQSLSGLSVPEERSRYFGHRFSSGEQGSVVTVNAPGREADAERILVENGGDLGNEASSYDYSQPATPSVVEGPQRIQLLGEILRVQKDRVSRGEVRIRKEVITETQTVEVPVTREELVIERTAPTDVHTATGRVGEGTEIRIPLSEEVASVGKDTVVREEVSVGKRAVQNVSSVGDNISHEELVVEDSTRDADVTKRTA